VIAYKFLSPSARGLFSGFLWPRPKGGEPGDWVGAGGPLTDCLCGIHACRLDDLPYWIDDELWMAELAGATEERGTMVIAERGRLLDRVHAWTAEAAFEFAQACVLRARDQAARSLRRAGFLPEADELASLDQLEFVQAQAAFFASTASRQAATAAAFAADAVALAWSKRPERWDGRPAAADRTTQSPGATAANLGFVVAHAAGREAAFAGGEEAYGSGFAAERQWQARWLAERLALRRSQQQLRTLSDRGERAGREAAARSGG
jgi:hypothetical protein